MTFEERVIRDLATLKIRTSSLPELTKRVDSLEASRDNIKGVAYLITGTGVVSSIVALGKYIGRYLSSH